MNPSTRCSKCSGADATAFRQRKLVARGPTNSGPRRFVRVLCSACVAVSVWSSAAGCRGQDGSGGSGGPAVGARPTSSLENAGPVVRRSSRAFNFLVAQGGHITVYDATAGRTLLSTQVPPQTLVRVDPRTGVFTGANQALRGPLPDNHVRELRVRP